MCKLRNNFLLLFLGLTTTLGFGQSLSSIEIVNSKFTMDQNPWFSIGLNYKIDIYTDNEQTYWVGPHHGYNAKNERVFTNQLDARMALFADFAHIQEMGFNTVRITGLEIYATASSIDKKIWVKGKKGVDLSDIQILSSKRNNKFLAEMAKIVIEEAQDAGLQVVFLTGGANIQRVNIRDKYNEWLSILCDSLKKCQPIFAIDLYNEPIYSNSSNLGKMELHQITKKWNATIKNKLPKTLTTIGLVGPEDAVNWDAEVLAIDFASYHLYPSVHDFEYVSAALFWISQTNKKPWIIGETSYSGSNDSLNNKCWGTELDQKKYALFALNRSRNSGAQGFSWWAFRDVRWNTVEDNMGVLNYQGKEKEVVAVFKHFDSIQLSKQIPIPDDLHYFHLEYSDYIVSGNIENITGKAIPNAVVCGWDKNWEHFTWTFTDKNGTYRLGSKMPLKFIKLSAIGYQVVLKTLANNNPEIILKPTVLNAWNINK